MIGNQPSLFTVGYEGRSADTVLGLLVGVGVEQLLDVRWRPLSRKRGLSKSALAEACTTAGIVYAHDRRLGTPPELLRRARSEGAYDWDAYAMHLSREEDALVDASALAEQQRVALLCFEADPHQCHRLLVGHEVALRSGLAVRHL